MAEDWALVKVLFDGFWWVKGPPSLRHVLRETVLEWRRAFPEDEITLLVRRKHLAEAQADVPEGIDLLSSRLWPQALLAAVACAWAGRKTRADLVYVQNFAAHTRAMSAVFLHDVLYLTNPEWFTRLERAYFRLMPLLLGGADVVLTSSRTEAERIRTHTRAASVAAVGIGMSTELLAAHAREPALGLTPGRFLLAVGRLNVRKNLAVTIEAAVSSGALTSEAPLVVVGSADGKSEALSEMARQAIADGRVVFTGYLADEELVWLYRNTSLFVFMTRGEGFGMPAIEALYFGAPMLVSDIDVFHEILPAGVPKVVPESAELIAESIRQHIDGGSGERRLAKTTQAEAYTWERTVQAMRAAILARGRQLGKDLA